MNGEFDFSEVTNRLERTELELQAADCLNGKLMRMIEQVLTAWHTHDGNVNDVSRAVEAMAELEKTFDEACERRLNRADKSSPEEAPT